MQYYLLCFGSTEFTKSTIRAIVKNSVLQPEIYLINNGWNERIVPPEILKNWSSFTEEYRDINIIKDIYEVENVTPGMALNAFSIAEEKSKSKYYWITDNDCLVDTRGFDFKFEEILEDYPELHKIGADFPRGVNFDTVKEYSSYIKNLELYMLNNYHSYYSLKVGPSYNELANRETVQYKNDPRVNNNLTDTTLSLVRKGSGITQNSNNRYSFSSATIRMLHLGYMENNFKTDNDIDMLEMVHYMNVRCHVLKEFEEVYTARLNEYLTNLKLNGCHHVLKKYNDVVVN